MRTVVRKTIQHRFPGVLTAYRRMRGTLRQVLRSRRSPASEFERIHATNAWGSAHSVSGEGSELAQTAWLQKELPRIFAQYEVKSFLDAPCGDFHWMSGVDLSGIAYHGVDIVPSLIDRTQARYGSGARQFVCRNIIADDLPRADLILSRDCLVHLPLADVWRALANFRRTGATYLLTTTFPRHTKTNWDIAVGDWRPLNLQEAPFHFPEPLEWIDEHCTQGDGEFSDKSLALWRLSDLPLQARA
jgi:hypothetical protein